MAFKNLQSWVLSIGLLSFASLALAQSPVRLRGVVEKIDASTLTFKERSGEVLTLQLPAAYPIQEIFPIGMSAIEPNAFLGIATVTRADGVLEALEVLVFPEAARGAGEGHYAWDLQSGSSMTNATVANLVRVGNARTLTMKYKDGEKTIFVPESVPVVTFKPADVQLLVSGAFAMVTAVLKDGDILPTVARVVVGRNGFKPPM
jgi:hypothetical protein